MESNCPTCGAPLGGWAVEVADIGSHKLWSSVDGAEIVATPVRARRKVYARREDAVLALHSWQAFGFRPVLVVVQDA